MRFLNLTFRPIAKHYYSILVLCFSSLFIVGQAYCQTNSTQGIVENKDVTHYAVEPLSLIPVRIGVLANRGYEEALDRWTSTADYLSDKIKGRRFEIVPLNFDEVEGQVSRREIDFLVANSSYYIELEALYRVERILTLSDSQLSVFGGVIFCRADRKDINTLQDLKGKSFMGADYKSLGGWRAAWGTLKEHGIDPYKDFSRLEFGKTHRAVPLAVEAGKVDAGTVRTDTLERMEQLGLIDTKSFRIINRQTYKGFPYLISTKLYPEWPFSKLSHTPNDLAKKVAIELLQLSPDSLPCKAAGIDGWTIPLDYHAVSELLKQLRLGPYKDYGKISLIDAIRQYWYLIVLVVVTLTIMAVSSVYIARLNSALHNTNAKLKHEVAARKTALEGLEQLNVTLAQERDKSQGYLDVVGVMVVALDKEGLVVLINRKGCELLGYKEDEILNKNWFDLCVPGESREDVKGVFDKVMAGLITSVEYYENPVLTKDGEERIVAFHNAVLYDSSHSIVGILFSGEDITERKLAEQEKQKLIEDLQKALSEIKQLSRILPICSSCKKIRDDKGYWSEVEAYISDHSETQFSHGICPDCMRKLYPEYADEVLGRLEKDEKK